MGRAGKWFMRGEGGARLLRRRGRKVAPSSREEAQPLGAVSEVGVGNEARPHPLSPFKEPGTDWRRGWARAGEGAGAGSVRAEVGRL